MTTQTYCVQLANGSTIEIENVATAEKDGSGRRFYGEDGSTIASFDDGEARGHWPKASTIVTPSEPSEPTSST